MAGQDLRVHRPRRVGGARRAGCGPAVNLSASAAAEELRESYRDRELEYPVDWQLALGTNYDVMHVTPEELNRFRRRLVELCGEYRRLSRVERPAGSRRVVVTADFVPGSSPTPPWPGRPHRMKSIRSKPCLIKSSLVPPGPS